MWKKPKRARLKKMLLLPLTGGLLFWLAPQLRVTASWLAELKIGGETAAEAPPELYLSHGYGWNAETEAEAAVTEMTTVTTVLQAELPTETTAAESIAAVDPGVKPYPEVWNTGTGRVIQTSLGGYTGNSYIQLDTAGKVRNCTDVENETLLAESRLRPEFTIECNAEPQVLIMHTHTTESFEPCERTFYDASFNYRTTDASGNVVMVGDEIAAALENVGIVTLHDTTIHDYPSYNGSYARSGATVSAILAANPSIKVVLDIHRDAITEGENILQPIAMVNGEEAAQVMIISGCDDGTMGMPAYLQNFRLASLFQQQLESDYTGLTRPVLFDYRKYNQNLTTGSLLLEIGAHGNTLAQAQYAGKLVGESLARALLTLT